MAAFNELTPAQQKVLDELGKRMFDVETLETRNVGDFDFHEVSVWTMREALAQAFLLGQAQD